MSKPALHAPLNTSRIDQSRGSSPVGVRKEIESSVAEAERDCIISLCFQF